jgi:hypothetical protein
MQRAEIKEPKDILNYIIGGKGTFTLENKTNGNRYTYKMRRLPTDKIKEDMIGKEPLFVSVMTGTDNERDYTFIGTLWEDSREFIHSKKSIIKENDKRTLGFNWLVGIVKNDNFHPDMAFYHEGKCGSCGKKLTVPESIITGLGPVCAENIELSISAKRKLKLKKFLKNA